MRVPPALSPGSTIAVVAPASPFPRQELLVGLAWLRTRYRLVMSSRVFEREGYLAGSDVRRASELEWALTAPGIDAVFAARGGYGVMRALEHVDLSRSVVTPRWVVGFSDLTALHVALAGVGVASVHGPNVTGLANARPREKAALLRILERPDAEASWEGLAASGRPSGKVSGLAFGGNLALLEAMAAAGRLRVPDGAILFLEDVSERPYRVDRMLTALALGGHLARAAGIVVGGFDQCDAGPDGVTVHEVLAARLSTLGVPVLFSAPFGHGAENQPFALGVRATLTRTASTGVVAFG